VYVIKKLAVEVIAKWEDTDLPSGPLAWGYVGLPGLLHWAGWEWEVDGDTEYVLLQVPPSVALTDWAHYSLVDGSKAEPHWSWALVPNKDKLWWSCKLEAGCNRLMNQVSYRGVILQHDCENCRRIQLGFHNAL
jgi:hypothetical protein